MTVMGPAPDTLGSTNMPAALGASYIVILTVKQRVMDQELLFPCLVMGPL
jgi:hypothetical protein